MENKIQSIILTDEYKKEIIHNALCNGLGQLHCYGLELYWNDEDYTEAKKSYYQRTQKISGACYEDILMELLEMNKKVVFVDLETDEIHNFNLQTSLKNLDNLNKEWILQLIEGNDDSETADVVLQFCLFNEIVFG
jgi:hypothetical protein